MAAWNPDPGEGTSSRGAVLMTLVIFAALAIMAIGGVWLASEGVVW